MNGQIERRCKCGCGQIIKPRSDGVFPQYRKGHKAQPGKLSINDLIECACAYCSKPIKVERWRVERFGSDNVFCCRQHAHAKRSADAIKLLTCENCGKKFHLLPSKKQGKHIYCNLECAREGRKKLPKIKIDVQCAGCGKALRVFPSIAKKNRFFYCSIECRADHIKGQNNPSYTCGAGRRHKYGETWRRNRRAVVKRDNYTCQHCGIQPTNKRHLHVHHKKPFYMFNGDSVAANHPDNLITLCKDCHPLVERGKIVLP